MIRDPLCNKSYWDNWAAYSDNHMLDMFESLKTSAGDPSYLPQFITNLSRKNYEQIIRRYSRGDPIESLSAYFEPMLDAWEKSEQLGATVWSDEIKHIRHTWAVNFDCYHGHFWKIALALLLAIPDEQ